MSCNDSRHSLKKTFQVLSGACCWWFHSILGLAYPFLKGVWPYTVRPNSSRSPRTQYPDTNPRPPANDPILPFRWTRCYGLAEKPDFIEMERVDSKSKMGFVDSAYNNWLYFSFTKMWVFTAIVVSSITVWEIEKVSWKERHQNKTPLDCAGTIALWHSWSKIQTSRACDRLLRKSSFR